MEVCFPTSNMKMWNLLLQSVGGYGTVVTYLCTRVLYLVQRYKQVKRYKICFFSNH